jgi:ribosomal protein L11 methyltransferase
VSDYTEVTVDLAATDLDTATAIAHLVVPYGFYVEDYSALEEEIAAIAHTDLIDADLLARDRTRGAIHLYLPLAENPAEAVAFLTARLDAENIRHSITLADCRAEDWENNWKQYFRATDIGEKLRIVPAWLQDETPADPQRVDLVIDPGLAFGTGNHATTRLCLELLETVVQAGDSVLDVGCGSGILGIVALLLGAGRVCACDIDPVAIRAARENAARNGQTAPQFLAVQGSLDAETAESKADLILANIVADVLIPLAHPISEHLNSGGKVILSGIIASREDEVIAAYAAQGLQVCARKETDGWVAIEVRGMRRE